MARVVCIRAPGGRALTRTERMEAMVEITRAEMGALLQRLVATLYPEGVVPPGDGGPFFRAVCDERRRLGDLFWTERRLHDLARALGLWPWSFTQIEADLRRRHPIDSGSDEDSTRAAP